MLWSSIVMDETTLFDLFVNGSPLAGFAGYLVWQTRSMQNRFDQMSEKSESREDDLRARYDKVITDLQSEKEVIKDESKSAIGDLSIKIDSLERQLQDVEKKFDQIMLSIQQLSTTVQELRFKDIVRDNNKNT